MSHPEAAVVAQQFTHDFVDHLQRDDAFLGLKRVPRWYVRIPEDQRAILERSDCWYGSRAGDQSYYANIPATVMQDLTEFRNRKLYIEADTRTDHRMLQNHTKLAGP
mgnify:CR=1 FL=1